MGQSLGDYPEKFQDPVGSKTGLYLSVPRYRANLVNYWASFVRNRGRLKSEISLTERGAHLSPGDISKEPERFRRFAAINRAKIHDLGPLPTQQAYRDIYADMINNLNEKGAEICLVTFPAAPDFQAALKSVNDAERADILTFFRAKSPASMRAMSTGRMLQTRYRISVTRTT